MLAALTPIAEMSDLIAQRTESKPGTFGGYFKLNPRVDDIPDRFTVKHRGITLLELGAVERGGSGCICPESVLLKQLVSHILLRRKEMALMDMYAGVEHLGRATAEAVEAMIVVVEPTGRSLETAAQIKTLAADIGLRQLFLVSNKIQSPADRDFVEAHSPGLPVIGHLPYTPQVQAADHLGRAVYDIAPELVEATNSIAAILEQIPASTGASPAR
jgi:CO dehydrogenase maturation factor